MAAGRPQRKSWASSPPTSTISFCPPSQRSNNPAPAPPDQHVHAPYPGEHGVVSAAVPAFVRTQGTADGKRLHRWSLLVLAGGPLVYWIIIGSFAHQAINLVYGGKFLQYSGLVWIVGLQPVIAAPPESTPRCSEPAGRSTRSLWRFVAAVGAITFGVALTKMYGLAGLLEHRHYLRITSYNALAFQPKYELAEPNRSGSG